MWCAFIAICAPAAEIHCNLGHDLWLHIGRGHSRWKNCKHLKIALFIAGPSITHPTTMNIPPWVTNGPLGQHWPSLWHSCAQARARRRRGRHKDREKGSEKHRAWVLWDHWGGCGWGVCKKLRAHAQGKDQARKVDSLICQLATIRRWSLGVDLGNGRKPPKK